ncbi:MAG: CotS family spore coat protein [Sarcina sp.]
MAKIKYRDAKYLCRYDLDIEFFNELNLNIKDLWPTRNIFMLDCEEGKKILKIVKYNEEKLSFIVDILEHLKQKYKNVLSVNKFESGNYIYEHKGEKYILLDLIEGVECNLYNPSDIKKVSNAIAYFHKAGEDALEIFEEKYKNEFTLGSLQKTFGIGKSILEECKKLIDVKLYKNEFDKIFLENLDYNMKLIEKANELLDKSSYSELCSNKKYITVCHNDLAYHNLLINEEGVYFIDFDYASIDLRILDVYNFIFKTLKKHAFNKEVYDNILNEYTSVISLDNTEIDILKLLLVYPSDFISISKNYYFALKDWSYESYLNKLETKVLCIKEKEIFLKQIL